MPRFKIGDTVYSTASLDEINLRDLMVFNSQVTDMGAHVTFSDIEGISRRMEAEAKGSTDPDDVVSNVDRMWLMGVTIWISRRRAGENVTLEQAVDIPLTSIDFIPDPEDHAVPQKRKPTRRPASAPVESEVGAEPNA